MEYGQKTHSDGENSGRFGDYLVFPPSNSPRFSSLGSSTSFTSSSSQRRLSTISSMYQFGSETSLETPVPASPESNDGRNIFPMDALQVDLHLMDYSSEEAGPYLDPNQMAMADNEAISTGVQSIFPLKSSGFWDYPTSMNLSDSMHAVAGSTQMLPQFPSNMDQGAYSNVRRQAQCCDRSASPALTDSPSSPLIYNPCVAESKTISPADVCGAPQTPQLDFGSPFSTPPKRTSWLLDNKADAWGSGGSGVRSIVLRTRDTRSSKAIPSPAVVPKSIAGVAKPKRTSKDLIDSLRRGECDRVPPARLRCGLPKKGQPSDGEICNRSFRRSEHLSRHYKSAEHCANNDFICPVCMSDFDSGVAKPKKKDDGCFNRRDNLNQHLRNVHLTPAATDKGRIRRITEEEIVYFGLESNVEAVKKKREKDALKQAGHLPSKSTTNAAGSRKSRATKKAR